MGKFKGTSAKEFLLSTSPDERHGLRAELQKNRLRGMVERKMEMYAELRIMESKAPEMLEMLEMLESLENDNGAIPKFMWDKIQTLIKQATEL